LRTSAFDAGGGTALEAAAARITAARRLIGIVSPEKEGGILREERAPDTMAAGA
jgi:hypothetical protein